MTDRNNPPQGFLERWSRKKIDAERDAPAAEPAKDVAPADGSDSPEQHADAQVSASTPPTPEFDLASLPSLDSITATTDIRAFLSPGVPKELARAALRRAWAADPAIRNFKGLAEYDWDFTDPNAMVGFGALEPGYDVQKLVAQLFSEGQRPENPDGDVKDSAGSQEARMTEEIAALAPLEEIARVAEKDQEQPPPAIQAQPLQVTEADVVHRNNNIASHNSNDRQDLDGRKNRRPHGGALHSR